MFSVMYMGMKFFPLCTAMVIPTNSGVIIDERDQVLIIFLSPEVRALSIFFKSFG